MATVTVPSFKFAVFFYPEILAELRSWVRLNVPEITSENDYEVAVQLIKAFALVGHLNSVNTDAAANEAIFGTAKLLESVRQHFKLIGVEPDTASPSTTLVMLTLSKHFDAATDIVQPYAQVATEPAEGEPGVVFEYIADEPLGVTVSTHWLAYVYAVEASVFSANFAADAESGTPWTPFASLAAGDAIYFGHPSIWWLGMDVTVNTPGADYFGVWEFYAGNWDQGAPDAVTDLGSTLRFDLNSILGENDVSGATVRVMHNPTGVYEDVVSTFLASTNVIETATLLGQTSPSTDPADYTVGAAWRPFSVIDDDSSDFQDADVHSVAWHAPFQVGQDWQPVTVNGVEAFWVRWRCVEVGTPTEPVLEEVTLERTQAHGLRFLVTQGQLVTQEPLATGTGEASQQYTLARTGYIGSTLTVDVDGDQWTEVENFLNSSSLDRHFTVEVGADDLVLVTFGDGTNGAIPAVGATINAYYRIGADTDGNVSAWSVVINRSGIPYVNSLANYIEATGWRQARGKTAADLELLKVEGPAEIRTLGRACTDKDFETVALLYTGTGGTSPVVRAFAIINELGPKTVGLHVVAAGAGILSADTLEDLADWFNGDEDKGYDPRILSNYSLSAQNYSRRHITVEAVVYAKGVTEGQVKAALMTFLNPLAVNADGVTWRWDFGEKVPRNKIISAIDEVAPDKITDLVLTQPAADEFLNPDELPYCEAADLLITVVEG